MATLPSLSERFYQVLPLTYKSQYEAVYLAKIIYDIHFALTPVQSCVVQFSLGGIEQNNKFMAVYCLT